VVRGGSAAGGQWARSGEDNKKQGDSYERGLSHGTSPSSRRTDSTRRIPPARRYPCWQSEVIPNQRRQMPFLHRVPAIESGAVAELSVTAEGRHAIESRPVPRHKLARCRSRPCLGRAAARDSTHATAATEPELKKRHADRHARPDLRPLRPAARAPAKRTAGARAFGSAPSQSRQTRDTASRQEAGRISTSEARVG